MCGYLFPAETARRLATFLDLQPHAGRAQPAARAAARRRPHPARAAAAPPRLWPGHGASPPGPGVAAGAGACSSLAVRVRDKRGAYNLTLPTMGLFLLLAAAASELRAAAGGADARLACAATTACMHGRDLRGATRSPRTPRCDAREALRVLRHNRYNVLRVVDGSGSAPSASWTRATLLQRHRTRGAARHTLGELLAFDRRRRDVIH